MKVANSIALSELTEQFSYMDDWEDRYRYIIELGQNLSFLSENERVSKNIVQGCMSQVWLVCDSERKKDGDLFFNFRAHSDAMIVNGLIAILSIALKGKTVFEVIAMDIEAVFAQLGLLTHLSSQRGNGLRSMIERIKNEAKTLVN